MSKVFVGGLPPEATTLVAKYVEKFLPDATLDVVSVSGIRGRIKNQGARSDVMLIILSDEYYDFCKSSASEVLSNPKCHRYLNLSGLNEFLSAKFGENLGDNLSDSSVSTETEQEADYVVTETNNVEDTVIAPAEDTSSKEEELRGIIATKNRIIGNLKAQLAEITEGEYGGGTSREVELENQVKDLQAEVTKLSNESYVQLGKVAKAEQVLSDLENAQKLLNGANTDIANLRSEKTRLNERIAELNDTINSLDEECKRLGDIDTKYKEALLNNQETLNKLGDCTAELEGAVKSKKSLEVQVNTLADKVQSLMSDLADRGILEERVKELEPQIEALIEDNDALKRRVSDYEELEQKLADVSDRVEKLKSDNEGLINNLSELKDEKTKVDNEFRDLNSKLRECEVTVSDKNAKIAQLNEEIAEMRGRLDDYNSKSASLQADITALKDEISILSCDKVNLQSENSILRADLEAKEKALSDMQSEMTNLQTDLLDLRESLNSKSIECGKLSSELDTLTDSYNSLSTKYEVMLENVETLKADNNTNDERLKSAQEEITTLKSKCASSDGIISSLTRKVDKLQTELEDKVIECDNLSTTAFDCKQQISNLGSEVDALNTELSQKGEEIKGYVQKLKDKDAELLSLNSEITSLRAEISALEGDKNRASEMSGEIVELNNKVSSLTSIKSNLEKDILDLKVALDNANTSVSDLKADKESLKSEVSNLNSELEASKSELSALRISKEAKANEEVSALKTTLSNTESSLREAQREVARLTQESAGLRSSLDIARDTSETDAEIAGLKERVSQLKGELSTLKSSSDAGASEHRTEVERLTNQLMHLEKRNKVLIDELESKVIECQSIEDNIFSRIANFALPKVQVQADIALAGELPENCVVFASASGESTDGLYSELFKMVLSNKNRRYLVLDLVTDTYIDVKLGVSSVKSPIEWLKGNAPLSSCTSKSKLPNVSVVSTALGYFNETYLLNVDWVSRLSEASKCADTVILCVGCLGSVVHNVMYSTLTSKYKGYVFVKATPINLRTAILHLSGLRDTSNSTVCCLGYSEKTSKRLYDRLSSLYSCQIIGGTDIVKV